MREKDFSIYNPKFKIKVDGGHIWKAPARKKTGGVLALYQKEKKLGIYLHPDDDFTIVQDALFDLVKKKHFFDYLKLQIGKKLPSLLLFVPIIITLSFIGFITIWGELVVNWFFLGENSNTVLGIPMHESAMLYAVLAVILIYFFPVLFTGGQGSFIETLNRRFANREVLRKRFRVLVKYLKKRGYIETVEIWNPDLANPFHDWVGKSLIPSFLDNTLSLQLQVRIDERRFIENYFHEKTKEDLEWEEMEIEQDEHFTEPIAYEYLETWEKTLLAVYVFASTASLTPRWHQSQDSVSLQGLKNVVSLRLVKVLMEQFAERLFSQEDLTKLVSLDLFSSRCVNDYALLIPAIRYTNDVWAISKKVVAYERKEVAQEMKFMVSYLQKNMVEVIRLLEDPVAAIKLCCIQEDESIYNENRLAGIRFFVSAVNQSEQYKILKTYWNIVVGTPFESKDMNNDIYRIVGLDSLLKLATGFEHAGMYEHAYNALEYIEQVYPFKGKIGKARIKERQGDYREAVLAMLKIREDWKQARLRLNEDSIVDLNLDISWAITSGRLLDYQAIGLQTLAEALALLNENFDTIRNSGQTIRSYNISANYEEWQGNPERAIANYDKALKIPGVHQSGLSNLLVNKGIALRQIHKLESAIFFGEQGVSIKLAIGDTDQSPIALHNLAQTYIELAFSIEGKEDKVRFLRQALKHAQKGLDIQAQTGSTKKRGQLLAEKFIGEYQLSLTLADAKGRRESLRSLKLLQTWLKNESELGEMNAHDCNVLLKELFGLLENTEFNSLEDIMNWSILPLIAKTA